VHVSKFAVILALAPALSLFASKPLPAQESQTSASAAASEEFESELSGSQWAHLIETYLVQERFDDLDRMAAKLRSEKSRHPGGGWKLSTFYGALDKPESTDQDTQAHLAHLDHWIQQRPESITARVALATSLHRWAWVARGNGMADTVTDEGWRLFNERIEKSRKVLEAAAKLHEKCPQWYSEMMIVGLAQNWDEKQMKAVFEQGIQFEPGYFGLYKQFANYLQPKWDGKPGDASAFAKASADKLGGEAGDEVYFHIATVLVGKGGPDSAVHEMDWPRIQRGYLVLTTKYGATTFLKNEIALMAYAFQDAAFARKQFDVIGNHWSRSVWKDRERFDRARDWAQSHS
jgi:hypothetical protein